MLCSELSISGGDEQKLLKLLESEWEGEAGSVASWSCSISKHRPMVPCEASQFK